MSEEQKLRAMEESVAEDTDHGVGSDDELLDGGARADRDLKAWQEAHQLLEDQLEDANAEIDRLRQEVERLSVQAEEAEYQRDEVEKARKKLEQALYEIQEGVEESRVTSLRDARMQRRHGLVGVDSLTMGPFVKGVMLGLGGGVLLTVLVAKLLSAYF